ncbi:TIGR02679 family protein [Halomonas campisalis]|uniref:TIGR02679 family protein n=1 Tax=Billgrantia campisalis TaxID=74661 RepID=A0ABS9P614_9GAMM|nr:TIGR02679 family protein [Halomonas campisalis]MCG6657207.1 TIGR02679 family protein [Halomonas campisalis]MDR5862392.1 TIGR02679 family protein [Halomonas campisalis]
MDLERLQRLLGGSGLARLRQRLSRKLMRDGEGRLTLSRVSDTERAAVERLVGRAPRQGKSLSVDLEALSHALARAGVASDLRAALEALDGPLVDGRAEREEVRRRWRELLDAYHPEAERLEVSGWLEDLRGGGQLKRLAGRSERQGRRLLEQSLSVLKRLPTQGMTLSTLAAECLGDAHALDAGRPVSALVRRALARHWRGGVALPHPDERSIWAHAGVLLGGDITSAVLIHRLPLLGEHALDPALRQYHDLAEPAWLTLRQLLRHPPQWDVAGRQVFVCENPAVVAEAAECLGSRCAPLMTTWGRPGAAALTLLEQLQAAGAVLYYHGDFDWAGVSIANSLLTRFAMRPWRMKAVDLEECVRLPGRPLEGKPLDACWDPQLRAVLEARNRALHEEQLIETLLEDLRLPVRPQV